VRCGAITKGGSRCKLEATHGSYCYQHAPETAEERRRSASRGGRAGGNGRGGSPNRELAALKAKTAALYDEVHGGKVDAKVAAVCVQVANTQARILELERRWRELYEVEERLQALEQRLEGPRRAS
jgi:hypothetical protein